MICNSFLFFDRMAEMMIIVGAVLPDMNPVDVLHCVEKFEPRFEKFTPALTHMNSFRNNRPAQLTRRK